MDCSWVPLCLLLAPLGLLLASSWLLLGCSWAPLRHSKTSFLLAFLWVSPWDLYFRLRGSKKLPLGLLLALLGLLLACSRLLLGSSWAPLGSFWLLMGSFWLPLGYFFFGRRAFSKDDIVYVFLCSRFPLGLLLGPLGSSWTRLGLLLGSSRPPESCLRTLPSPPSSL